MPKFFVDLRGVALILIALASIQHSAAVRSEQAAGPPGTAIDWLSHMRQAAASLSYQGMVAYIKDQQVDSFKLYHRVTDGHERERLISMNSPYREVIRADGNVTRYSAEGQQVVVETKPSSKSVLINLPDDMSIIERFYRISLRGQEYVAGSLTQVIALEPRDAYRYTRLFWVDTITYLPLKLDVLNEDGQSVEQMVFTAINARDPIAAADLEPSPRAGAAMTRISHRETKPVGWLKWTLEGVPEGFQIMSYSMLKRPPSDVAVEHILMSDGFSSVSVYIESKDSHIKTGTYRMGAISADTVLVGGYSITVMGEVPMRTVELIASGIKPR
ncbi:MAG: MucB/RseB C-terminal domain-containing protein [Methylococcus sp.]